MWVLCCEVHCKGLTSISSKFNRSSGEVCGASDKQVYVFKVSLGIDSPSSQILEKKESLPELKAASLPLAVLKCRTEPN